MAIPEGNPDRPTQNRPNPRPVVEREADESDDAPTSTPESGYQPDYNISNKQFRYNPPIHSANRSIFLRSGGKVDLDSVYDEAGAPKGYTGSWGDKNLNTLRLGRIIQHYEVPEFTRQMKYRWGFRFLYNPTSLTFAASRNNSFVIDGRSETNRVLSGVNQNFQTISFKILLDRVPDLMAPSLRSSDYSPSLSSGDKAGILKYGTHWDLEALFKISNGEWNTLDRGRTSNIGVLIPNNARLILGKGDNLYGFVESVGYTDTMFTLDMVPIRTEVNITFRRHVDMTPDQVSTAFPGIGSVGTPEDTEDDSGGTPDGSPADNGSIGNNSDAPVPGYNRVTRGFWAHGGPDGYGGWDYGLGGIAGKPVHATHGGFVERVRSITSSYGKHVYVKNGNLLMIYAHLSSFNPNLRVGQRINEGDWIGRVGNTGNSDGNHLHYEERLNGVSRMPLFAKNTGNIR